MANYSTYYQNYGVGREIAPEMTADEAARLEEDKYREQDRLNKENIQRTLNERAFQYAQQTGASFDEAKKLIQTGYENSIKSANMQAMQQTKDLQAQNVHIDAVRALYSINPADKNSVEKYNQLAQQYSQSLAGSKYFDDFSKQLKTSRDESLKYSQQERMLKTSEEANRLRQQEEKRLEESSKPETIAARAAAQAAGTIKGQASATDELEAIKRVKDPMLDIKQSIAEKRDVGYAMQTLEKARADALNQAKATGLDFVRLQKPEFFVDAEGRKTSDPEKIVSAGWSQKGKKPLFISEQDRQNIVGEVKSFDDQLRQLRSTLKAPMAGGSVEQPDVSPVEQPLSTGGESFAPSESYSSENPYASAATEEASQKAAKEEESSRKQMLRRVDELRNKMASSKNAMENIPDTQIVSYGEGISGEEKLTAQDKARLYEKAKKEYDTAESEYSSLLDKIKFPPLENQATTSDAPSKNAIPLGAIFK